MVSASSTASLQTREQLQQLHELLPLKTCPCSYTFDNRKTMKTLFVFLNLLTFLYFSALVPTNAVSPPGKVDETICDDQLTNQNCGSQPFSNSNNQANSGFSQPFPSNNQGNSGSGQPGISQPFASNNQGNSGSGQPGISQPFASNNQGNSGSGQPGFSQPFASNNQNSGSGQQGFGQPFGSNNQGNSGSGGQAFSSTNLPFLQNTRGNNIPFINEASDVKKLTLSVVLLSAFILMAALH